MPRKKVLITVTTYPLPSSSYDDLVCTAGFLEDGSWIRIYPIPFRFLINNRFKKYQWVELDLYRKLKDFRPESYSPTKIDLSDMKILDKIDTKRNWLKRKELCLNNVYTSLEKLIADSKKPKNKSLAVFKPTKIIDFIAVKDKETWNPKWIAQRQQGNLFVQNEEDKQAASKIIDKIPFKFKYIFEDENGKRSKLMVEDWEIGALYRKYIDKDGKGKELALEKVISQYRDNFIQNKDLYFFLGTTKKWHLRRSNNPFVIIGVFYPKKEKQFTLF